MIWSPGAVGVCHQAGVSYRPDGTYQGQSVLGVVVQLQFEDREVGRCGPSFGLYLFDRSQPDGKRGLRRVLRAQTKEAIQRHP